MEAKTKFWFDCKVKYGKTQEDGVVKVVKEEYLVDAMSFAEAEARITKEMESFISGEFDVATVKKNGSVELFKSENADANKYYQAKVSFIAIDEKTGAERKTAESVYIHAVDFDDALFTLKNNMRDTMSDWEISALVETAILDAYEYND